MHSVNVLLAQSFHMGSIKASTGSPFYGAYAVRFLAECQKRYQFLNAPTDLGEMNSPKGWEFLHGAFYRKAYIKRLTVYNNGFLIEAPVSTNLADEIIDDLIDWATRDELLQFDASGKRFYSSTLECSFDSKLAAGFGSLSKIGSMISGHLQNYGQIARDLEATAIAFGNDGDRVFRFEAREGRAGTQFCSAPLRTDDHIQVLKELDSLLLSMSENEKG